MNTSSRRGAPPEGRAPAGPGQGPSTTQPDSTRFSSSCKPPRQSFLTGNDHNRVEAQLQTYLDLGLTPIPLKGKRPIVKWKRGGWNPTSLEDLKPYLSRTNWGIRTGGDLAVIDFDTEDGYCNFVAENGDKLPPGLPIVRTGRGYHLWFRPTEPLRDMHFEGIDIKGEGGQVVAPPSIHPKFNKRYRFISPPKGDIPSLDVNELVFPNLKKHKAGHRGGKGSDTRNKDIPTDKPRFNFADISDGVDDGGRTKALTRYIGHLIWRGFEKEEIRVLAADWNTRNRPPLSDAVLEHTVNDCYARYATDNTVNVSVPTKTLANCNSVVVGTRPYRATDRAQPLDAPESPMPTPASAWETEPVGIPRCKCGSMRSVMRMDREYLSVSFFCCKWSCPNCGAFFRQRWIDHMMEITENTNLHVIDFPHQDWDRVRKQIDRLGADYMKIRSESSFKVVLNKPIDGATGLAAEDRLAFLESSIPATAHRLPISTSRPWKLSKDKADSEYTAVTTTWLPTIDQRAVAQDLGARIIRHNRWNAPEDADQEQWADEFTEKIRERENEIEMRISYDPEGVADYLTRQYREDMLLDEERYGDAFDRVLEAESLKPRLAEGLPY